VWDFDKTANLSSFFFTYIILNKSEFGFGKNKSREDAVDTVIENIVQNLNNKVQFCTVGLVKKHL
jgi:hypothetical protein